MLTAIPFLRMGQIAIAEAQKTQPFKFSVFFNTNILLAYAKAHCIFWRQVTIVKYF